MEPSYIHRKNFHIIAHAPFGNEAKPDYFDHQFWDSQKRIVGSAQGRGKTWFFQWQDQDYVLRHYYRGGIIGKILKDRYFYTGLERSQPWKEWQLLDELWQKKFPVPQPIAVQLQQQGLFYTADLITKRIPKVIPLSHLLKQKLIETSIWCAIGKTLKLFHDHGVYHADLNAHNILIDPNEKVWIVDFTRSYKSKIGKSAKQRNLQRLKDSLIKVLMDEKNSEHNLKNWSFLLNSYKQS